MLAFFKIIYFWNLTANAVGTVLGFVFAFYQYKAIKGSPWFTKVFVAIMLSWGIASLFFLGRICWEILNSTAFPTLAELKGAMKELDKIK